MLLNSSVYAPVAVNEMYAQFENHLINVIKNDMPKKSKMSASEIFCREFASASKND